jgi:hypothetical protein
MNRRMTDAILKAFEKVDCYLSDLSDDVPIVLPVIKFRLGDLRQLKECNSSGGSAPMENCEHSSVTLTTGGVPRPGE